MDFHILRCEVSNKFCQRVISTSRRSIISEIADSLDSMEYRIAAEKLDRLVQLADPDSPVVTALKSRLEMETVWEEG